MIQVREEPRVIARPLTLLMGTETKLAIGSLPELKNRKAIWPRKSRMLAAAIQLTDHNAHVGSLSCALARMLAGTGRAQINLMTASGIVVSIA